MSNYKKIVLGSGGEEGMHWELELEVGENTKNFAGHFVTRGEEHRQKQLIRYRDIAFFQKRLGNFMEKYEIDHDWDNGARVTLKTPEEHRNTPFGKPNQRDWIQVEEWL